MKGLPDFFQYGEKKLRSTELSKVMQSVTRLGILLPPKIEKKEKRPGRKTTEMDNISGPNVQYGLTTLDRDLKQVLSSGETLVFIHSLLGESLLQRLMTYIKLVALYVMEINRFNKEKAWDICKSVFPVVEKNSSFQSDFETVATGLSKRDLNEMANK